MSFEQRHIIHRQVIELRLPSRQDAFRIQSRISQLFQEAVAQRLSLHFDRLGLGEAVLRIPRLEINLGRITPESLDRNFTDQCAAAIQLEVERILRQLDLSPHSHGAVSGPHPAGNVLISAADHHVYALRLFLTRGILPPAFQAKSWKALEALWMEVLEKNGPSLIEMLRELAATTPTGIGRLVRQFSPAWIKALLEQLPGPAYVAGGTEGSGALAPRQAEMEAVRLVGFSQAVWQALPEWLKQQLQKWIEEYRQPGLMNVSRAVQLQFQTEILRTLLLHSPAEGPVSILQQLPSLREAGKESKRQESVAARQEEERPESLPTPPEERAGPGKLAVQNAGLVILHPFLPALFDTLGYLEGKNWKNKEAQERALHLLLYLARAEEQLGEHDFTIPKLLCGWPANEPVDRFLSLAEEEKQEAVDLLQAAIKHWAALKTTSAALLQDGFLQRSGLLQERPDSWLLQMERKAQDVLLDKLPWGASMAKLPWMGKRVVVEW